MSRFEIKLDERICVTYQPASVDGHRRAIIADPKAVAIHRESYGSIEVELSDSDRIQSQIVAMPISLARAVAENILTLCDDAEVKHQAATLGPDSAAGMRRFINRALRDDHRLGRESEIRPGFYEGDMP